MHARPARNAGAPLPGRRVRGSATGRPVMAALDLLGGRVGKEESDAQGE